MNHLRVVFAPGVVPGKWLGRFDGRMDGWKAAAAQSDDPLAHVRAGRADIALLRFPGEWDGMAGHEIDAGEMERQSLHRVLLYEEQPGVAAPRDHALEATGENETVTPEDIADDMLLYRGVDPAQVRDNLEVVAANVGIVVAPRPLLRSVNRRGVVHRNLGGTPGTRIGLVWRRDRDDEVIQQFVGICRGRRASSSR
ncbi:MAG: LysR substrate-binding domain-containing protein [Mycobacteriaceae bacterium]|uniref:LysR substrate-binding domain-containing protein n=1 Tax=Corynebacterium sp. TaxID=1720 RepID=UPI003F9A45D3